MNAIYKVVKWDSFENRDLHALYMTSEKKMKELQEIFSVDDDERENTYAEQVTLIDESDTVYLPVTITLGKDGDVLSISPHLESITVGSDELIRKQECCITRWLSVEITVVATSIEEAIKKAKAKYNEIRKWGD